MNKFFLFTLLILTGGVTNAQDTLVLISGRKIITDSVGFKDNSITYKSGKKMKTMENYRVFSIIYKNGTEEVIYKTDSLDPMDFKTEEMRNFIKGEQDAVSVYKNNTIKIIGIGIGAASGMLGFYGLIGPPLYATIMGSFSPNVEKTLSFNVSGDAAASIGITPGKYLNEVSGNNTSTGVKKDQKLKLGHGSIKFKEDMDIDKAVTLINSKFSCTRVNASNDKGNIRLFKTNSSALIPDGSYKEGFSKKVRDYKIRNAMIYGLVSFVVSSITYGIIIK